MAEPQVLAGAEPFFFEGDRVGVVVSHGFTGTTHSMRYLGEYLAREGGFTVSGVRLTGHGTTPEDMAQSTAEDWIRTVETAVQELRRRCDKVFITGLSMGGTLALYVAAMHPELVAGAIPINGTIFFDNPDLAHLAFKADAPAFLAGIGSDIKQPGVTELAYPVVPVRALRQIYALICVTRDLLPRVVCPTLIIQSREDHVVPPANGPFMLERICAQDKQFVWLENSYHVATLDNDKDLIGRLTVDFIRQRS